MWFRIVILICLCILPAAALKDTFECELKNERSFLVFTEDGLEDLFYLQEETGALPLGRWRSLGFATMDYPSSTIWCSRLLFGEGGKVTMQKVVERLQDRNTEPMTYKAEVLAERTGRWERISPTRLRVTLDPQTK